MCDKWNEKSGEKFFRKSHAETIKTFASLSKVEMTKFRFNQILETF